MFWGLGAHDRDDTGAVEPVLRFFTDGAARGEQLLYVGPSRRALLVASDPDLAQTPGQLLTSTREEVFTTAERSSPLAQAAACERLVGAARAGGWTALRIASDATPPPTGLRARRTFLPWEIACEELVARADLSVLCLYDELALDPAVTADLAAAHGSAHRATGVATPFRVSREGDAVALGGEVDAFSASSLLRVLDAAASRGDLRVLDLHDLVFLDVRAGQLLARWVARRSLDGSVALTGASPVVRRLWDALDLDVVAGAAWA